MSTKKKSPPKRAPRRKPSPATPVANHRFEPGTKVSFLPAHLVTVERSLGREPIAKPTKTATVKANGALEVRDLPSGSWCACALVGETWRYFQFSVKA